MDGLVKQPSEQAASQLQGELQAAVRRAHATKRPILTHLNADTTWLLSLAYPDTVSPPAGRLRYNILIDPWLDGPQEDVAGWFSKQWHSEKSSVQTISGLEDLIRDAEAVEHQGIRSDLPGGECSAESTGSFIDAVVVSHEFTDHCHQATLLQLNSSVPVFATKEAARLIRSWHHFDTVLEMETSTKDFDWRKTSLAPLPDWVGIARLVTDQDALYYHSAIVITVQKPRYGDAAETIVYTPHGVEASTLSALAGVSPSHTVLAFLHGLHDVSIVWSKQLNLGAMNAIRAQKWLRAKYWIGTHDEEKPGSGLIAHLLRRKTMTVAEAVASLQDFAHEEDAVEAKAWTDGLKCVELKNGESILLD